MGSEISKSACRSPYQNCKSRTSNLARTVICGAGCRPLSVRSEIIAEYESVDTDHLAEILGEPSPVRGRVEAPVTACRNRLLTELGSPVRNGKGIVKTKCVDFVKKSRS